jgi:two-component system, OmpR family, phosphate regulon response regulator OmpR
MLNAPQKDKIIVVDDDSRLLTLLERFLFQSGFDVYVASSTADLSRQLSDVTPDLIVLDVMIPGENGIELCKRMRAEGNVTPIIMLTAMGEEADRITGLESGADDYIAKPFNPRELLARINAVLRRRPPVESPGAPSANQEPVRFGRFLFDLAARSLQRDGQDLALTTGEFAMLKTLVRHPRQPLSRDKLAALTRGRDIKPTDRSLDVQMSRLRRLIEEVPTKPRYLQTVWGVGYVFVPDGEH